MARQETTLNLLTNSCLKFLQVREEIETIQSIRNDFIPLRALP